MSRKLAAGLAVAVTVGVGAGVGAGFGLALAPASALAAPPAGMPDPSQMSGIPRPDPNLTPGTVTVRCLDGGFDRPAIGTEVVLEIATAAGPQIRTATTADQGRAIFAGLDEFFGSSVVARATVAGHELRSQSFVLGPQSGVALMLVAGGGGAAPAVDPHAGGPGDPHGGQGPVPMPGKPFPLAGRPRGTLIVGALGLAGEAGINPIADTEVTLTATAPELAQPIVEKLTTDVEGKVSFVDLDQRLPAGAQIVVEAVLEDGEAPTTSEPFTLGETAYAVVLTRGFGGAAEAPPPPPSPEPAQRVEMPPQIDRSLPPGKVRVVVVDAHDRPVAGQSVVVHTSELAGGETNRVGDTDAEGMVIVDEVPFGDETLTQVRAVYEGAPYVSTLFELPEDAGGVVMLRVFRPTGDRTRVRSALQIDVSPRENDIAAVSFNYAVFVDGEDAFWVPGGMTIFGPPGTRSLFVAKESEAWLVHDGETPWAELDRPLIPGVELRLSFIVGMQHDGTLELEWSTPFPLVDEASLVTVSPELSVTHGVGGAPEIDPHAGRDGDPLELYRLGYQPFELGVCDLLARAGQPCPIGTWAGHDLSIVVEGLPIRSRVWPYTAWSLLGLAGLGVLVSVLLRRRVGAREALLARRDALIAELVALGEHGGDAAAAREHRARLLRTLDRIYRQLAALGGG